MLRGGDGFFGVRFGVVGHFRGAVAGAEIAFVLVGFHIKPVPRIPMVAVGVRKRIGWLRETLRNAPVNMRKPETTTESAFFSDSITTLLLARRIIACVFTTKPIRCLWQF